VAPVAAVVEALLHVDDQQSHPIKVRQVQLREVHRFSVHYPS